ncbi:MAG: ribonuclease H-like YkuK family protein [Patescibacteria group bacterium]
MPFVFHNLSCVFDFGGLIEELVFYVREKPECRYQIVVGTDSQSGDKVQLVSAVGVWRIGNGGRYFWAKSELMDCPSLRDRIYKETIQSITLMQELKSALKDKLGEEFFWDNKIVVHIDVGYNGPTREFIDGVVGMVRGFGFEAAIKPAAFGAFVLADRHT